MSYSLSNAFWSSNNLLPRTGGTISGSLTVNGHITTTTSNISSSLLTDKLLLPSTANLIGSGWDFDTNWRALGSRGGYVLRNNNNGGLEIFNGLSNGIGMNMTITSNGNIGIGTYTPLYKLDVNGVSKINTAIISDFGYAGMAGFAHSNNATGTNYAFLNDGGSAGNTFLNCRTNGAICFREANVDRMVLSNAMLGIGKSSPSYKLDVSGDINFTGNLYKNNSLFSSGGSSQWSSSGANVFITSSNVGIGTSAPAYTLDVNGPATFRDIESIRLRHSMGSFLLRNEGSSFWMLATNPYVPDGNFNNYRPMRYMFDSGTIHFGNQALTIQDAGNIGIGNASPTNKLDVTGTVRIKNPTAVRGSGTTQTNMFSIETSDASPLALNFNIIPSSTTSQQGIHIHTVSPGISDDHNLVLQSDMGRVGIGNKYPSFMLDVNGQARFTGNYTTSDAREKKNIELVNTQNSESIVRQLQVKRYNWLAEDTSNVAPHIGWIAQDVQEVAPDVVIADNAGKLSISYGDIQAHMCAALQRALEKIDNLENENLLLKERLERLENV